MAGSNDSKNHKSSASEKPQKPVGPAKDDRSNGIDSFKKEIANMMKPMPKAGDLVNAALRIADERHRIELKMKEALLAGDDDQLRRFARLLLGLPQCEPDPKGGRRDKK
ncbi:MAG TPA: hypothetical protein VE422_45640 [Terriglobia bacterium]|nr:hypothetical protein [Terriglobia bacterium]